MKGLEIALGNNMFVQGLSQHDDATYFVKLRSPLQEEEEASHNDTLNYALISCLSRMLQRMECRYVVALGWLKNVRERGFFLLLEELGYSPQEQSQIERALIDELIERNYNLVSSRINQHLESQVED